MEPQVAVLAADSGPLVGVRGVLAAAGRYTALEFVFASGRLSLRCDDDTDEIIVETGRTISDGQPVAESWVDDLLGKWIEYAWKLRNHRGYEDGFQLRLIDGQRGEEVRQFEVAGSAIDVRRVSPAGPAT
jgi:hypothetical protein